MSSGAGKGMRVGAAVKVGVAWGVVGARGTRVLVNVILGVFEGRGVKLGGIRVRVAVAVGRRVAVKTERFVTAATAVTRGDVGLGVIVEPSETPVGTSPAKLFGNITMITLATMTTAAIKAKRCQRRQ